MGDFIDPTKAKEIGLINRIVKEKDLKVETLKVAKIIASKATATVAIGKEALSSFCTRSPGNENGLVFAGVWVVLLLTGDPGKSML